MMNTTDVFLWFNRHAFWQKEQVEWYLSYVVGSLILGLDGHVEASGKDSRIRVLSNTWRFVLFLIINKHSVFWGNLLSSIKKWKFFLFQYALDTVCHSLVSLMFGVSWAVGYKLNSSEVKMSEEAQNLNAQTPTQNFKSLWFGSCIVCWGLSAVSYKIKSAQLLCKKFQSASCFFCSHNF